MPLTTGGEFQMQYRVELIQSVGNPHRLALQVNARRTFLLFSAADQAYSALLVAQSLVNMS